MKTTNEITAREFNAAPVVTKMEHGMNWIRQEKRLAIYLRDGCACAYCGTGIEDGAVLTLDHIKSRSNGGTNDASNLVTCCLRCNSVKGDRTVPEFAKAVAAYLNHGVHACEITKHVKQCTERDFRHFKKQADEMIALRGSAKRALRKLRNRR